MGRPISINSRSKTRGSGENAADSEGVVSCSSDVGEFFMPLGDVAIEAVLPHL